MSKKFRFFSPNIQNQIFEPSNFIKFQAFFPNKNQIFEAAGLNTKQRAVLEELKECHKDSGTLNIVNDI